MVLDSTKLRIDYLADHQELLPELARLHLAEWGRPNECVEDRIERLRPACAHQQIPTTFIATADGELLGSALLVSHDMDDRPRLTPWLAGVFVKPPHRNMGIASGLIARVEAEAVALGVAKLYLYTASAAAYYSRLGWCCIETCAYHGSDVTIMSKAIESRTTVAETSNHAMLPSG